MTDYDFYLRHAAVREGAWVGFALARRLPGGAVEGEVRPHLRWRAWILDSASPNNPAAGSWGVWQWRLDVALFDGYVGLLGTPPDDARGAADMRGDLLQFLDLPELQLMDVDGTVYACRLTGFREQAAQPYDPQRTGGGWLSRIELTQVKEE